MPSLLPLGELGIGQPVEHWWQWAFIGIVVLSAFAGSVPGFLLLVNFYQTWSKVLLPVVRFRRPFQTIGPECDLTVRL